MRSTTTTRPRTRQAQLGTLVTLALVFAFSSPVSGLTVKSGPRVFPGTETEQPHVRGKLEAFLERYIVRQEVQLEVSEPYGNDKTYTYYLNSHSGLVVRVTFSRDMVSEAQVDKELPEGPVLFTPAWAGTFRWKSSAGSSSSPPSRGNTAKCATG